MPGWGARHVVEALGGHAALAATDLGPIPHPAPSSAQPSPEALAAAAARRDSLQGPGGPFGTPYVASAAGMQESLRSSRGSAEPVARPAAPAVPRQDQPQSLHVGTLWQSDSDMFGAPAFLESRYVMDGTGAAPAVTAGMEGEGGGSVHRQTGFGDSVTRFDEVAAARGALGRFPGSEVMPLLCQVAGVALEH